MQTKRNSVSSLELHYRKKNLMFSIYSRTRTERFAKKKKMQQFTVQQGKKIVFTAAEKYGFTVPLCKNGK